MTVLSFFGKKLYRDLYISHQILFFSNLVCLIVTVFRYFADTLLSHPHQIANYNIYVYNLIKCFHIHESQIASKKTLKPIILNWSRPATAAIFVNYTHSLPTYQLLLIVCNSRHCHLRDDKLQILCF